MRTVRSLAAAMAVFAASTQAAIAASEGPSPSDALPPSFLAACDARALSFPAYDRAIENAVNALDELGVFARADFAGVRIGFCDLRAANGPAATTACASDTILLDAGYGEKDQALILAGTLAHEMKHVLQHRARRAMHGAAYCESDDYAAARPALEIEADAFSDGVGALLFAGRRVEVRNDCPAPVRVYLEADKPRYGRAGPAAFVELAPQATTQMEARALSGVFRAYAEKSSAADETTLGGPIWGGPRIKEKRIIEGARYGLQRIIATVSDPAAGPFQLRLDCAAGAPSHDKTSG